LDRKKRSPAYPSIPLSEAIEKVRAIYRADKGAPGTMEVIASHLESSPKSSGFLQAVSSIVRYGLMDDLEGKPRRLKVSKSAIDIILLPDTDPRRIEAIQQAALAPKPFMELWSQFGIDHPSDQNLQHELVQNRKFQPDTASDLIEQYKKTIQFAKLGIDDKIDESKDDGDGYKVFSPPELSLNVRKVQSTQIPTTQIQIPSLPPLKQDAFITDNGDIVVRWPSVLPSSDKGDLAVWLARITRRILDSVESPKDGRRDPGILDHSPAKIEMNPS